MKDLSRRSFVELLGAAVSGAALPEIAAAEPQRAAVPTRKDTAGRRPNIIVMICDDIGSADPGCYGSNLQTPNLDRMAAEGMLFTHYDTPHPICSAARAAVMTGRYANRNGNLEYYSPTSKDGMSLEEVTVANVLHDAQYKSMCIGKWHLGHMPEYLPTSRGFDHYFGVPYSVDMDPLPLIVDKKIVEPETDRALLTPRYTKAAVEFIDQNAQEPFFLYVAYSYPHIPIDASPRFKGKSSHGIYGDAVEEIDWSVGEILKTLERNGLEDKTLILFTSDHGPWFQGSTGNRIGRKGSSYEGGCRVPMIAQWKGTIPAGHVCNQWATHLDLLPTFAALAKAKLPQQSLDGMDISSLLTGGKDLERAEPVLYFSALKAMEYSLQCARQGKWKVRVAQWTQEIYLLGRNAGENLWLESPELYDLEDDPGESYSQADLHPEIVKAIMATLDRQLATFPKDVVDAYNALKKRPASTTTPAGSHARAANYVTPPFRFEPVDS